MSITLENTSSLFHSILIGIGSFYHSTFILESLERGEVFDDQRSDDWEKTQGKLATSLRLFDSIMDRFTERQNVINDFLKETRTVLHHLHLCASNYSNQDLKQRYYNEATDGLKNVETEVEDDVLEAGLGESHSTLVILGLLCLIQTIESHLNTTKERIRKKFIFKLVKKYFIKNRRLLREIQESLDPTEPEFCNEQLLQEFIVFHRFICTTYDKPCEFPYGAFSHDLTFEIRSESYECVKEFTVNPFHVYHKFVHTYEQQHPRDVRQIMFGNYSCIKQVGNEMKMDTSRRLYTASLDKTVKIWDEENCVKSFRHRTSVVCFTVSYDGEVLVAGCKDCNVYVWNLTELRDKCIKLKGHTNMIRCVCITHTKSAVCSVSSDCQVRFWDTASGECTYIGQHRYIPTFCIPNGEFRNREEDAMEPSEHVFTCSNDHEIKMWDTRADKKFECVTFGEEVDQHTDAITYITLSSKLEYLISCSWDCSTRIWKVADNSLQFILADDENSPIKTGHTGHCTYAVIHPNEEFIVTCSNDNTCKIWTFLDGLYIKTLEGHSSCVNYACFTPNGEWIISASHDKTLRIWDFETGACISVLHGHFGPVFQCMYTEWGIISRSKDNLIKIWKTDYIRNYKIQLPRAEEDRDFQPVYITERNKSLNVRLHSASVTGSIRSLRSYDRSVARSRRDQRSVVYSNKKSVARSAAKSKQTKKVAIQEPEKEDDDDGGDMK